MSSMKTFRVLHAALALAFMIAIAHAEDLNEIQCAKSAAFFAPPDSPDRLKYAPDREIAIVHLAIDVTPDFTNRTVEAVAITRFKPIAKPVQELKFDGVDLDVHSV